MASAPMTNKSTDHLLPLSPPRIPSPDAIELLPRLPSFATDKYLRPQRSFSQEKFLSPTSVSPSPSRSALSDKSPSPRSLSTDKLLHSPTNPHGFPEPTPKPGKYDDDRLLALSVTLTLVLLLLIGLPLGAVLPQKYVKQLPVNILVPFYVSPNPGNWDRLFRTIIKHGPLNFTVIINPDDGPGDTVWPPGQYVESIKALNNLPNVRTVGYVNTDYGRRDNATVNKETITYAGWNNTNGLAIDGIFFDKTPWKDEDNARAYLRNISATVRHSEGFLDPRLVIHNPGTVPNENLTSYHADITVVFEGEYQDLPKRDQMRRRLKHLQGRREDYAFLVHSVPKKMRRGGLRRIIDHWRRDVEWLFVTDLTGDKRYEGYGSVWEMFLDLTW